MRRKTQVLFAPEGRIISHAIKEILSAKKKLDIAIYLIGSKRVANTLVKAKKKGLAIRVITDGRVAKTRYSLDNYLSEKGLDVKTIRVRRGSMHCKFILIDGRKLIAGSSNLTNDAEYRNFEFIFIFEDRRIIKLFANKFEEMWN